MVKNGNTGQLPEEVEMTFTRRLQHRWSSSNFVRHATTLAFGTLLAQFITFFTAPIITRLFDPQDYGVLSVFGSWIMIISVVATGRYEYAVLLGDAREGWYCTILTLVLTALTAIVMLACGLATAAAGFISPLYGLLAALSVLALGINLGLYYWFNRNKRYPVLARNRIYGSIIAAGFGIGAGVFGLGAIGLVTGSVVAQVLVALLLVWPSDFRAYPRPETFKLRELAWRYRDYPKYLLASGILDRFSGQAHILLLVFLQGGAATAGFIGLYERVVSVPQRVLSLSIGDVFKQQASTELTTQGECLALYKRTTRRLALTGLAPSLVLVVAGPWLFGWVFGADWRTAGELAQVLAAKFYLGFIVSPLSSLLFVGQAQRYDLYLQLGLAVAVLAGLVAGAAVAGLKGGLVGYTAVYCCKYMVEYWIAWRIAAGSLGKLSESAAS